LLVNNCFFVYRYGRRSNWFKIHCLLQEPESQDKTSSEANQEGSNVKDPASSTQPDVTISKKETRDYQSNTDTQSVNRSNDSNFEPSITVTRKKIDRKQINKKNQPVFHPYQRKSSNHVGVTPTFPRLVPPLINPSLTFPKSRFFPNFNTKYSLSKLEQNDLNNYNKLGSSSMANNISNNEAIQSSDLLKLIETYKLILLKSKMNINPLLKPFLPNASTTEVSMTNNILDLDKSVQNEPIDLSFTKEDEEVDIDIESTECNEEIVGANCDDQTAITENEEMQIEENSNCETSSNQITKITQEYLETFKYMQNNFKSDQLKLSQPSSLSIINPIETRKNTEILKNTVFLNALMNAHTSSDSPSILSPPASESDFDPKTIVSCQMKVGISSNINPFKSNNHNSEVSNETISMNNHIQEKLLT